MDESLWPARNVAEYAYCPRLFYLMEVEGIHVPSDDTESGQRVHRRVDAPSNERTSEAKENGDRPQPVRSLTLTSTFLGLTATLDLAEIEGKVAVPIEYRKGRPRHLSFRDDENGQGTLAAVEPWPTDRIQVALQSLLLEEAGYQVKECVLYYAAEKRRVTIPFDDALRQEALSTLAAARETAAGPRPLPLVNDARCPRCSLQPICLPDEVNFERDVGHAASLSPGATGGPPASVPSPRKLWPPRDDGIHLVAQQDGCKVGVSGASMKVTDKEGKKLTEVPLANVESLSLLGSVQISTQAVQTLADRGIPIAYLSAAGRLLAMIDPLDSVSAQVRRAQVRRFDDPVACLELARALIVAKIQNQRTLLMRNSDGLPQRAADDLAVQLASAHSAPSIDSLRGHEGQAAAIYFEHFSKMLKSDLAGEFDAHGRQRRPPPDPINAALSFAYSMLTHECVAALRTARLEPSIGAFHVSRPGRPALALDLLEPFRPLLADSIVISAFNRGELKPGHFLRTAAGCMFTDPGRKAFFTTYGRRLSDEVTHPVYNYKLSYRRMLILHSRLISAWLLGELPGLSFLTTR
ncbi:MAG: CRISPR-associated endonuclease Cas4g/Cas1g [Pirellulaceae bacterium]